jgi:hypothetical protein
MKIKVRSRYREGIAKTGVIFDNVGKDFEQWRQFVPPHPKATHGEAYMTPGEAKFLVESPQNRMHIDAGLEMEYSYPAGFPVPVADNFDGILHPPLTNKSFHISDTRQLDQAAGFLAERDRAIALGKARADAEARGDDPADVVLADSDEPATETATARRARIKAEREAARGVPAAV